MFKLLTPATREEVKHEYFLRRVSVAMTLVSILLFYICVSLTPSLILARTKKDSATLFLSTARVESEEERGALETWAEDLNTTLKTLVRPTKEPLAYEGFREVLKAKAPSIKITSLRFFNSPDKVTVKVAGVAKDRQTLLTFQNNLKLLKSWSVEDIPVDSLTKDVNVDFEIALLPKTP